MATPTPVSSTPLVNGNFQVKYSDGSTKVLSAPQAQALGALPSSAKPSVGVVSGQGTAAAPAASAGGYGTAGGYGGSASSNFPSNAVVPVSTSAQPGQTLYDPNTGTTVNASGLIPQKDSKGNVVGQSDLATLVQQARVPANAAKVRSALVKAGVLSKTEKSITRIQNAWVQTLIGAQASQMDPFEYLSSLRAQGFGQNAPVTTNKITDYSNVADGYFYQAYNKVFGRMPTQMDAISPYKDAKGNPLTWQQAFIAEAKKPENQEVTTTTTNPDGTISSQVSKPGLDPQVWFQQSLTNAYADAIKAGKASAEQSNVDKYNQLAAAYGVNTIDPTTKQFDVNSRMDLANIESGKMDFSNIQNNFRNAALAQYGNLKTQLVDANQTLKQIAQPAYDAISKILEKDPGSVTINDPLIQKYLQGGTNGTMPMYQFETLLKQDPSWQYTNNAHSQFETLGTDILKRFGMIG